jgi:hypothetical protein
VRVITEASSDGSRTTVMSSDTTVSVLTPAPMSASAVHVMRAGPPVATEAATALMPSAATTRLTTVASEVAQTGTPSTGAGSPCALRMSSVGLYCSLVVSCHRSCPLFRERPLMPKGRRAAALASADQGLSTSAMLPADTEQRPPEGGSLQSGAVTRIARARMSVSGNAQAVSGHLGRHENNQKSPPNMKPSPRERKDRIVLRVLQQPAN